VDQSRSTPHTDAIGRRSFFRQILAGSIDQIDAAARKILPGPPRARDNNPVRNDRYLRPPGAATEPQFTDLCAGCRACLVACPAQCIQMDAGPPEGGGPAPSTEPRHPYIVPRQQACVICDDLACTHACPTGALHPLEAPHEIRMGQAVMDHQRCLRGLPDGKGLPAPVAGEECRICVDHCPIGEAALFIDGEGLAQVGDACVGCGMCEWSCPTDPSSIEVVKRGESCSNA